VDADTLPANVGFGQKRAPRFRRRDRDDGRAAMEPSTISDAPFVQDVRCFDTPVMLSSSHTSLEAHWTAGSRLDDDQEL